MNFESRRGPKKKKQKIKRFITWKVYFSYFFLVSFSLLLFFYTSKVIIGYLIIMNT
jgi:hypothetical protein